jgi:hypothetical protein
MVRFVIGQSLTPIIIIEAICLDMPGIVPEGRSHLAGGVRHCGPDGMRLGTSRPVLVANRHPLSWLFSNWHPDATQLSLLDRHLDGDKGR